MAINATSTSSSYNFIMRNYYSKNRPAAREVTRKKLENKILVTADSSALSKVAKTLRDLEYSSDNGVGIYNNIKAFVDTYNNLSSSTSDAIAYDITRPTKKLKNYIINNKDQLESIGINVSASGKLKVDKEKLLKCSPSKISKVLSSDSGFSQQIKHYAGKIYKASNYINLTTPNTIPKTNTSGTGTSGTSTIDIIA